MEDILTESFKYICGRDAIRTYAALCLTSKRIHSVMVGCLNIKSHISVYKSGDYIIRMIHDHELMNVSNGRHTLTIDQIYNIGMLCKPIDDDTIHFQELFTSRIIDYKHVIPESENIYFQNEGFYDCWKFNDVRIYTAEMMPGQVTVILPGIQILSNYVVAVNEWITHQDIDRALRIFMELIKK
jgi:hypothetical protein